MYIIYHSRDLDGYCSGAICKKKYPDAVLVGYDYGQPIPFDKIEKGQPVIMVDVSLPMPDMVKMGLHAQNQFTWIDHHVSAILDYLDLEASNKTQAAFIKPYFGDVFNQKIAACELTWQYLFPEVELPMSVLLLGQFDTWRNENKLYWDRMVLPFQYGMKANGIDSADVFPQELLNDYASIQQEVDTIINNGKIALQYQKAVDKVVMQNAFEIEFAGLKGIACNGSGFGSMAFDSVPDLDKYDLMMPFKFDGKGWVYSLYTTKSNVDCSKLAKAYGGGGHKQAAGFQSHELIDFIQKVYKNQ